MIPDSCYKFGKERFTRHGETFLLVSPGSVTVHATSPEVIRQITSQRDKFPKPIENYHMLKIFGNNVVTTEGMVWKTHRKATSATFNERNAALVFREIIEQMQGMIEGWVDPLGNRSEPLTTLSADITRLTINAISYVGFGLRLLWPGQTLPPDIDPVAAKYSSLDPPPGYSMNFVDTLIELMNYVIPLMLIPGWMLRILPLKSVRRMARAQTNYLKYMDEMMNEKIELVQNGTQTEEGMDFMGQLVKGSYGQKPTAGSLKQTVGGKLVTAPVLTRDEILGNAFIMFVAGHETSANTIHFTMIHLATNPSAQRLLHEHLDELVGSSDPSTWEYEKLIGPLSMSAVGACMNETLRVIPPGPAIPKKVSATEDQIISVDGRDCVLPKGSLVMVQAILAHQNPGYWPYKESVIEPGRDDLREYKPERWFEKNPGNSADKSNVNRGNEKTGRNYAEDQSPHDNDYDIGHVDDSTAIHNHNGMPFFRPQRGAYLPFSDGARSCLGRRIAQVEILTGLAVLLQRYSIELATDEWASDDEVLKMGREARTDMYRRAQAASRSTMANAISVVTLGLQGKTVPMRLVKRGEEKFVNWMADA